MSIVTTDQGLTIPVLADNANVPTTVGALMGANSTTGASSSTGLESRLVKRYASTADRTARNPSPATGELSWRTDLSGYEYYTGAVWLSLTSIARGLVYLKRNNSGVNLLSNFAGEATAFTITVSLAANRAFRVWTDSTYVSGGATFPLYAGTRIKDGSTTIADSGDIALNATSRQARNFLETIYKTSIAASVTFNVTGRRIAGSVNIDMTANTDAPFVFGVDDIGPDTIVS